MGPLFVFEKGRSPGTRPDSYSQNSKRVFFFLLATCRLIAASGCQHQPIFHSLVLVRVSWCMAQNPGLCPPGPFWLGTRAPGTAGGFPVQAYAGVSKPVKPVMTRPDEALVYSGPAERGWWNGLT